jgi:peroxin-14
MWHWCAQPKTPGNPRLHRSHHRPARHIVARPRQRHHMATHRRATGSRHHRQSRCCRLECYDERADPSRPPKRDWRDYFIMATVMGGVGYGLYFTAKRYILPLVQPPTPQQLEQDKASIDESFTRAFDLLEQLNTDTTALKASEEARTSRLDNALGEVESVLTSLKESSKRQGDDNRRIEDDVRGLRDLIPKALDAQKESTDGRLRELSTELKSLKTLVGNRMAVGTARPSATSTSYIGQPQNAASGTSTPVPQPPSTPAPSEKPNGTSTTDTQSANSTPAAEKPAASYGRLPGGRAAIPAWQMAAQKKTEDAKKDTSDSGTAVEASASS